MSNWYIVNGEGIGDNTYVVSEFSVQAADHDLAILAVQSYLQTGISVIASERWDPKTQAEALGIPDNSLWTAIRMPEPIKRYHSKWFGNHVRLMNLQNIPNEPK